MFAATQPAMRAKSFLRSNAVQRLNGERFWKSFTSTVCVLSTYLYLSEQDLCFHKSELELEPTAVSRACLDCMQEPIGEPNTTHAPEQCGI